MVQTASPICTADAHHNVLILYDIFRLCGGLPPREVRHMDENPVLIDRRAGLSRAHAQPPAAAQRLQRRDAPGAGGGDRRGRARRELPGAAADRRRPRLLVRPGSQRAVAAVRRGDRARRGAGEILQPAGAQAARAALPGGRAVNGIAAGAACNIALACDIVLAARSATFLQAFARLGLVPDAGGTWLLPRLVGQARARGLALLAEPLPAEKAEAWGLIWKAVDDDSADGGGGKALRAFRDRADVRPRPHQARARRRRGQRSRDAARSRTQLAARGRPQPDYGEGVRAFLEKRKPNFSGKR